MSVVPAENLQARVAERIFSPLAQLRWRCRLYLIVDGLVRLYLALVGASLAQLVLDWGLRLTIDQRAALNIGITLFWVWILHRHLLAAALRPVSDRSLAAAVDRAHPELHDQVSAAVQFARGEVGAAEANSPQLVRAVLDEACAVAPRIPFLAVVNHRRARRRCAELGVLLAVTAAAFLVVPDVCAAWFRRNWLLQEVPWPQQTYIRPIGFDESGCRRVPRGDQLEIAAINEGRAPKSVELRWQTASERAGREPMTRIGFNRWVATLGTLTEDVSFQIVGGDERTREYVVIAVDRPQVVRTSARITPPAYTRLEPVTLEQQTVLDILEGSTLNIEAWLNKPVASARFVGSEGEAAACQQPGPDYLRVGWREPRSGSYFFELVDRDGWANRQPVRYTLKVLPDLPPEVTLELPDVDESITPRAELPVELAAEDTYGLGGVRLHVQRGDDPPFDVPLAAGGIEAGQRELRAETTIAIGTLNVAPGDRVRVWAEAFDEDPAGPNLGRTEPVELRVLTPADLLRELAGRELELRRDFERLISAQRGLGDALQRLLADFPDEGQTPRDVAQRLSGLARRQDMHASNCRLMSRRFRQILGEMRVNKVARAGDERRIGQRIVAPLETLGGQTMPAAAVIMTELRWEVSRARVESLPGQQTDILRQMRAILANMLEWEGYREAVALLHEVIAEQSAIRAATIEALEQQLEDILGLDEPVETAPAEMPEP